MFRSRSWRQPCAAGFENDGCWLIEMPCRMDWPAATRRSGMCPETCVENGRPRNAGIVAILDHAHSAIESAVSSGQVRGLAAIQPKRCFAGRRTLATSRSEDFERSFEVRKRVVRASSSRIVVSRIHKATRNFSSFHGLYNAFNIRFVRRVSCSESES